MNDKQALLIKIIGWFEIFKGVCGISLFLWGCLPFWFDVLFAHKDEHPFGFIPMVISVFLLPTFFMLKSGLGILKFEYKARMTSLWLNGVCGTIIILIVCGVYISYDPTFVQYYFWLLFASPFLVPAVILATPNIKKRFVTKG